MSKLVQVPEDDRRAQAVERSTGHDKDPPLELLAIAGAGMAALCLGVVTGEGWLPSLPARLSLVRIAAALSVIAALAAATRSLRLRTRARLRREWWDPTDGAPDGPLGWCQVHALVAFDPTADPLVGQERMRDGRGAREWPPVVLATVVLTLVAGQMLLFLWNPQAWPPALTGQAVDGVFRDVVSASGNLTAYLALLASGVTIVFTYGQLQARVRADSRQQWIMAARSLVAASLAAAEAHRSATPRSRSDRKLELDRRRIELELMLNPSEKDHRLLMYLVQRHALLDLPGEENVQDAVNLRKAISASGSKPEGGRDVTFHQPDGRELQPDLGSGWNRIVYASERSDLVAYILRLSHVVFKREWERVKHTR